MTDDLVRAINDSTSFVRQSASQPLRISVVVTAHNEGANLSNTLASVVRQTASAHEIIVVDDGSDDDSCKGLTELGIRHIRNSTRVGVAHSRNAGCAAARGDAFAFLDGHQRLTTGCLDECVDVALTRQAVVWPDVQELDGRGWMGHGGTFQLCRKKGYFSAQWCHAAPTERVSRINALVAPGYMIPRQLYHKLRWISRLRGWGGSEAAIGVKAFFLDIPLLHVCGPVAHHLFRKSFHYPTTWDAIWRNHALIARICFSAETWHKHWFPNVFAPRLSSAVIEELESPDVEREHVAFQTQKVRTDEEFWSHLLRQSPPAFAS